jgi:hypothetical protein
VPRNVGSADSCWLFISASNERRHLEDVIFGADVLRRRGVPSDRIAIFTDYPAPHTVLSAFNLNNVHGVDDLATVALGLPPSTSCFVVVTGHGNHDGIGQQTVALRPVPVLDAARSVPGIQFGVVVLGQCYAGVFNYLQARGDCPLVLLAGTGFNTSLSSGVKLSGPIVPAAGSSPLSGWAANLFLYYFFLWLESPNDLDGDGQTTLIDAHKFAGTRSSSHAIGGKSQAFVSATLKSNTLPQLEHAFTQARSALQSVPPTASAQARVQAQSTLTAAVLALRSRQQEISGHLGVVYSLQDAWVLHADLARDITFW